MRRRHLVVPCALGLVAAACTSTQVSTPLPAASAPGVTASSVAVATVTATQSPWNIGVASYLRGLASALAWANDHGGVAGRRIDLITEAVPATQNAAAIETRDALTTVDAFTIVGTSLGPATSTVAAVAPRLGASSSFPIAPAGWLPPLAVQLQVLEHDGSLGAHPLLWLPAGTTMTALPAGVRDAIGESSASLVSAVRADPSATLVVGDDLVADATVLHALVQAGVTPKAVVVAGALLAPARDGAWLAANAGMDPRRLSVVSDVPATLPASWAPLVASLSVRAGATRAATLGVLVGLNTVGAIHALGATPTRVGLGRVLDAAIPGRPGVGTVAVSASATLVPA